MTRRDDLPTLRIGLLGCGNVGTEVVRILRAEADELAARIRQGTTEMADPPGTSMFDHVYAEQTPTLAAQREEFAAYQASFEGEGH